MHAELCEGPVVSDVLLCAAQTGPSPCSITTFKDSLFPPPLRSATAPPLQPRCPHDWVERPDSPGHCPPSPSARHGGCWLAGAFSVSALGHVGAADLFSSVSGRSANTKPRGRSAGCSTLLSLLCLVHIQYAGYELYLAKEGGVNTSTPPSWKQRCQLLFQSFVQQ